MLFAGASVELSESKVKANPLLHSATQSDSRFRAQIVKLLVGKHCDPNDQRPGNQDTPSHVAAKHGHLDVLKVPCMLTEKRTCTEADFCSVSYKSPRPKVGLFSTNTCVCLSGCTLCRSCTKTVPVWMSKTNTEWPRSTMQFWKVRAFKWMCTSRCSWYFQSLLNH